MAAPPQGMPVHVTVHVPTQEMQYAAAAAAQEQHAAAPRERDFCYGCRRCWHAVTRALGATRTLTSLIIGVPVCYLVAVLIGASTTNGADVRAILGPSVAVVMGFTIFFAILAWVALWKRLQNLLGIAAFVFRAIGHWAMVSSVILILAGWSYSLGGAVVWALGSSVIPPILIFLMTAAVMDSHRERMVESMRGGG